MAYQSVLDRQKGIIGSQYVPVLDRPTGGFQPGKAPGLGTSEGLYDLATRAGLQKEADRILSQKGEQTKQIFSGGIVTDIFDALNALQYGIVGVLKGKGFLEGVRTRQSFSDKDALGDNGLPGVIGGIALDIAVDPLTYIAPWTILKKVPGLAKGVKAISKVAEASKAGQWLGRKFVYMFGKDPVYKEAWERAVKNITIGDTNIGQMVKGIIDIPAEKAKQLLTRDETLHFIRKPLEQLRDVLTDSELFSVAKSYSILDDMGKQAVDLGLLGKKTWEQNVGEYIKNAYLEYEQRKPLGVFGYMKKGIRGIFKRKELPLETRIKLGEIENPAYLLAKSMFDLNHDIENAKFFKSVAERFGSDTLKEGFKQLPITRRLITTGGIKADIMTDIKNVNQKLKPAFAALKQTFKADRAVLSEIHQIEKTMESLGKMRAEEFVKFFQVGQKITKEIPEWRRLGTLPDDLVGIGQRIKQFGKFDDLMKSDTGIGVEKLFREGVLERRGFSSMENFFEYVKKPFRVKPEKVIEIVAEENIPKLIKLQKQIEELSQKAGKLNEIDKRSINDAYRFWEDTISKLTTKKEELIEQLGKVKLGDLSGKFVPENIFDDIQEITRSKSNIEQGLGKIVAGFKFGKVVMNPATHARNVMSNEVLNWWKLGLGPWRQDIYLEAISQMKKGGRWIDEAKTVGYNLNTFASNEISDLLLGKEGLSLTGKAGSGIREIARKLGNIYQGEENFAKLAAFIFKRKQGLGIEDAWKMAESATFNYAQVTPFVRRLRESIFGFPFITFTLKATPIAVETALKAPYRISVFGKIKNAIENASDIQVTERERASEPAWIRDGFYIKLPIKDEHGRSAYFDLTYIIPFGDIVSGQFFTRQIKRETGLPETLPETLAEKAPLFNLLKELSRNQDFFGDKIWNETDTTDKQLGDLMRHLTRTYSPPIVSELGDATGLLPGGYMPSGERRIRGFRKALTPDEQIKQQRTLMQEILRNFGLKINPIDVDIQETYMEWEKRKALQTLLQESGIIKEFTRPYVPKK